jgi:5-methylcytosine-specific restriction endonuclease McrA
MTPFTHEPRKRFTAQERARVFALRCGRCHRCTRKLGPADAWILEHLIALENGGTNDESNLEVTCTWCEPEKTAEDHQQAGHGRRMFTKHVVPSEFRRSRAWNRRA